MSFGRFTSSPVLAMPAHSAHQVRFDRPVQPPQSLALDQSIQWPAQLIRTCVAAGRKRSRDEAAVNLDAPEKTVPAPAMHSGEDEWVYGPSMTLIKKSCSYVADTSSRSGTWVEEQGTKDEARKTETALVQQQQLNQERPWLRRHKSQRIGMRATPCSSSERSRPSSREALDPPDSTCTPVVDDFTIQLGIGWSRISNEKYMQAAARGWARYIENHFPVTDAKIRLESRGLQSYLVEAAQGFYLFAEDLRQGRLVSAHAERMLQNLKTLPIVFDGPETMNATESSELTPSSLAIAPAMTAAVPVEMDVC